MGRYLKNVGDWGENIACDFLQRNGFKVIERNFFTTVGEIDIVAISGEDYYFIEVKTRLDNDLATDLAIGKSKLRKLEKSMKIFCYKKSIQNVGLIMSGIIIFVDKITKIVKIRMVVLN